MTTAQNPGGLQKQNLGGGNAASFLAPAKRGEILKEVLGDTDVDDAAPATAHRPKAPTVRKIAPANSRGGASVIYVDATVDTRLTALRKRNDLTNLQVILEAVAAHHDKLREIIDAAKIVTRPVAALFEPDPNAVRFKGGGQIGVTYRPTDAQAQKLDAIGAELGFDTRSTWLAPVLEFHLRPRKRLPKAKTDDTAQAENTADAEKENSE